MKGHHMSRITYLAEPVGQVPDIPSGRRLAQQLVEPALDCLVARTGRGFQVRPVQDGDAATGIADQTGALPDARGRCAHRFRKAVVPQNLSLY